MKLCLPFLLIVVGFILFRMIPWNPNSVDPSIVYDEKWGKVQNGSAYDKAFVEVKKNQTIILPDDALIRREGEDAKIQVYMKKTLCFGGHPPEEMSIEQSRNHMGCALKVVDNDLVIATFGEWDSHIEGGASMNLLFIVPKGLQVEQRGNLSGEHSVGREWKGEYLTKPLNVKEGYWYGPSIPSPGWKALSTIPDPSHKAKPPSEEELFNPGWEVIHPEKGIDIPQMCVYREQKDEWSCLLWINSYDLRLPEGVLDLELRLSPTQPKIKQEQPKIKCNIIVYRPPWRELVQKKSFNVTPKWKEGKIRESFKNVLGSVDEEIGFYPVDAGKNKIVVEVSIENGPTFRNSFDLDVFWRR